jgi:penicillin-binding protein 1A
MTGGLKAGLIARDRAPEPRFQPQPAQDEEFEVERKVVPKWLRRILGL